MYGDCAFLVFLALAYVKSESVCEEFYTKKQFVITSNNYPNAYPENVTCNYFLDGGSCPRKYNFQFLEFDLEQDEECSKDYLQIGEQDKLCGSKTGTKTYFAPEGSLLLKFVTNGGVSGKGFKLLVTKLPCDTTPQKENFYNWKQMLGWNPSATQTTQFCCKEVYKSKHFYLSSPGFPYSYSQPNDCVYHIYKASENICRLRIHAVYFSHGNLEETCHNNFLEIDGKKICGCQTNMKLITTFDPYSNSPKVFRFRNDGSYKNKYSGFALEIFQDECPRKYSFQKRSIQNAKLLFENSQRDAEIVKHVYFFSDPTEINYDGDDFPGDVRGTPKEREEADYMDTSDLGFRLSDKENEGKQCGGFDFGQLARNNLWAETTQCKTNENEPRGCKGLNDVRGYLYSPGYPYYYPRNLNLCYRFIKQSGYCAVKLVLIDFQIEYSPECRKDYLLLGGKFRYCGQQLHNTVSTLDLSKSNFADVIFVTDSYYCNRGFKAIYEQIPCVTTSSPPPVTQTPLNPCDSVINEKDFTLDIFAFQQDTCIFTVTKTNPQICRLDLQSLVSNLDCNSEDVFVKGRSLCSLTESDTFSVDFKDDDSIPIVYKRFISRPSVTGLRIKLKGKQSNENCFYNIPEVPAEKLITSASDYGLFLVLNSNIEDFCGVIANTTFAESPEDSCKMLMETNTVKECLPAKANATELPDNAQELEVFLLPKTGGENVSVQKINCDSSAIVVKK